MSDQMMRDARIDALAHHGDASNYDEWQTTGKPDYVELYQLTSDDIPWLIELACEPWDLFASTNLRVWGPVHAWRALGQLRAAECVVPLLRQLNIWDEAGDDAYALELPHVWGMIGEPVLEPLRENRQRPRIAAIEGICEVGKQHPELRSRAVEYLSAELARHRAGSSEECDREQGVINGWLVAKLLNLNADEAAETIERTFAANVIDPTIGGDWGDVRRELGIEGLGLAPDRSPGWPTVLEQTGFPDSASDLGDATNRDYLRESPQQELKRLHESKQKQKARKKRERKNRKKNRKPR